MTIRLSWIRGCVR